MRLAKQKWTENQCLDKDNSLNMNKSKKAYQTVKQLTKTRQPKISSIQSKSGLCLTEAHDVLTVWTQYCSDLYNHTPNGDLSVLASPMNREEEEIIPIL